MIAALERAVVARDDAWTIDREMSAVTAEVLHSFMLGYFKVHGAKNLGKSLHIERPWDKEKQKKEMLSPGSFAAMIGGSRG
jgi:hypothetical protein